MKIHFLKCDDWVVIYIDGKKSEEGHSISLEWFLRDHAEEFGIEKITSSEMTPEQIDEDTPDTYEPHL